MATSSRAKRFHCLDIFNASPSSHSRCLWLSACWYRNINRLLQPVTALWLSGRVARGLSCGRAILGKIARVIYLQRREYQRMVTSSSKQVHKNYSSALTAIERILERLYRERNALLARSAAIPASIAPDVKSGQATDQA